MLKMGFRVVPIIIAVPTDPLSYVSLRKGDGGWCFDYIEPARGLTEGILRECGVKVMVI